MIEVVEGNILRSQAEWLVCPVNRVGVMGAGLAKAFKLQCEGLFDAYQRACMRGKFTDEDIFFYRPKNMTDKVVACLATKRHWKHPSTLRDIDNGLRNLAVYADTHKPNGVAVPMVGCGLGGLDRYAVLGKMTNHFARSETTFYIYNSDL